MLGVPNLLLKQLYTFGSLENSDKGVQFSLKNRLSDAQVTALKGLKFGNQEVPLSALSIHLDDGQVFTPDQISKATPIDFPLKSVLSVVANIDPLPLGKHKIELSFAAKPFGKLKLKVEGSIVKKRDDIVRIPRDPEDDYSERAIKTRQDFVAEFSGKKLEHVPNYSFDPHLTEGNCEHFTGVAQIPMGFAGPIKMNGEHAKGDFLVPLATAEGTLVASYNRGIKVINRCGGVKCSVIRDAMQRAPVFVFEDARGARDFVDWVQANIKTIAEKAEATTSIGKLDYIDPYLASRFAYLRFNFKTGDAAGQNMVGRATFAACSWILETYKENRMTNFYLESNLATDKKASQVNIMRTRGKRVTAEILITREVLTQVMRVDPEGLFRHYNIANVGAILSGANNNGLHSANAITALFIATGQDVANVSESSAAILFTELVPRPHETWQDPTKPENDLYMSITIPSLIVATYGGGTKLATQKECLEVMDCYGKGKVHKFAEIVAGVILAGEISLASAISSSDWVSSHEQYGRNR